MFYSVTTLLMHVGNGHVSKKKHAEKYFSFYLSLIYFRFFTQQCIIDRTIQVTTCKSDQNNKHQQVNGKTKSKKKPSKYFHTDVGG